MARAMTGAWRTVALVFVLAGCQRDLPPAAASVSPTASSSAVAPVAAVAPASAADSARSANCLVTASAVGALRLGMRIAEAQQALPTARFSRSSDGEGVALVDVALDGASLAVLYAGEEDPEKPVDPAGTVEHIETFNPACATTEGVHPASPVAGAEAAYGAIRSITRSEIESREYIEFERQPPGLQFRLDYTGEFAEGESETMRHAPGAKIFSIAISKR